MDNHKPYPLYQEQLVSTLFGVPFKDWRELQHHILKTTNMTIPEFLNSIKVIKKAMNE